MKTRGRLALCLLLTAGLILLLLDSSGARAAMQGALLLCFRSVIPSLFPFLVVSSLLLSLGFGSFFSRPLEGLMRPLFGVGGAGASAVILGLVGGYPVGARSAAELYRNHLLTREEAERLLASCNNSNPAFLISVLGIGIFGSARVGVWLWLIHLLSALLTGLLFRGTGRRRTPPVRGKQRGGAVDISLPTAIVSSIQGSLTAILNICAFVTFFYVLVQPLKAVGGVWGTLLVGLTELFSVTPLLTPDRTGFLLAAGLSGWGGISVLCQTLAVLSGSGLSARNCLRGKTVQGLLSALLALALSFYVLP